MVKRMPFELKNIVSVLDRAFAKIDPHCHGDLVLLLGQTGDGKSTMLAALMYGSDKLDEVQIKEPIKIPKIDGKGNQVLKDGLP